MKKTITLLMLITLLSVLFGCSKEMNSGTSIDLLPSGEVLNIGILPAEASIPIIIAKEKGFFEEIGVNVSIKTFTSPNDRNIAVQAKEIDGTIGDVMTAAVFVDRGIPMKITSDIREDFKILSSPNSSVRTIKALDGKTVSLVPNFILEYIMDTFAKENDITYDIVEIPSFAARAEALMSDQIDGVVFTEPQAGMLVTNGAHLLGSSKTAGIKGGAFIFTEDVLLGRPGDVKAFYESYNEAIDYMNEVEVSAYSEILANYQFPESINDYLSNQEEVFQYAGHISVEQFDDIMEWTKEKEQISRLYSFEELTDFSYID
ncbi:MAG: metal ABC transporter substrate-binding protein [Firmicutes bacterium HGW-Firmicutes-2]|jgi:NitT/TauT family transport system substrate-binding protein|nr:MAG: metal ABC transporter substrate-binding protein [Firmicutes bacterium HGW-Firmicutes-2]